MSPCFVVIFLIDSHPILSTPVWYWLPWIAAGKSCTQTSMKNFTHLLEKGISAFKVILCLFLSRVTWLEKLLVLPFTLIRCCRKVSKSAAFMMPSSTGWRQSMWNFSCSFLPLRPLPFNPLPFLAGTWGFLLLLAWGRFAGGLAWSKGKVWLRHWSLPSCLLAG